jgi:serine/threonine-protein kinase
LLSEPEGDVPVAAGETIGGRYVVDGMLAEGGMGVVCLGRHSELEQRVAIKFLRESYARSDSLVQRFLNEARAAATLKSEHVVRVMDVGQLETGRPYLVMEHLEGTDLEAEVTKNGPLDVDRAVRYALEVCEALVEAHSCGIIHRDIKPENLFLASVGNGREIVKVVDFGLAKRIDTPQRLVTTGPQDSMGSPCYMSPEQITTPHQVDVRTDVWSLGVVLYRLLSAAMPFDGTTVLEVYARVLNATPKSLCRLRPDVDAKLDAIVARCLEKDAALRYQTIGELAAALTAYQAERADAERRGDSGIAQLSLVPSVIPERRASGTGRLFALAALVLVISFGATLAARAGEGRAQARAAIRSLLDEARPHTEGPIAAMLGDASVLLAPLEPPVDENASLPYAPLLMPARGVVALHPVTDPDGQPGLAAEREPESFNASDRQGAATALSAVEIADRQEGYRRFLERDRLTPVGEVVERAPRAAESSDAPPPKPKAPSLDDLKAP